LTPSTPPIASCFVVMLVFLGGLRDAFTADGPRTFS